MPQDYKCHDIFQAAQNNDADSVKHFVEEENISVTVTNALGMTAAHIAATNGKLNILKYLVEKNATLIEMQDLWQQTVLHMAVRKGALDIVEYLIDTCGAKIIKCSPVFNLNTVLHIASEEGRLNVLEYFVEKKNMNVNERNTLGQPPVFLAANNDHLHVVEYLVDSKADVTMKDCEERGILHMCTEHGYLNVPKFLLDQRNKSLDVNSTDSLGRTIIYSACKHGHMKFIKYFVEEKHADVNLADNIGWTPLHLAAFVGNLKLVQYFVTHGADLHTSDTHGKTVLDSTTNQNVTAYLQEAINNRSRRSVPSVEQFPPYAGRTYSRLILERITESPRELTRSHRAFGTFFGIDSFLLLMNVFVKMTTGCVSKLRVSSFERVYQDKVDLTATDAIDSIFYARFKK